MSNVQSIMQVVEEAVDEYSNEDQSNTFNILQDIHPDVQPAVMMVKTCYMEFNPMSTSAELPAMFSSDFGSFIQSYVILQDPKRNQIRVAVEKKDGKNFFTHGWSRLRDFYDIGLGGWLTLLYISPVLFHLRVRKRTGGEVTYPERNPPYRFMLLEQEGSRSSNGPVPYFLAPKVFYHVLEKNLTSSDVETGILKLNWDGFCKHALPNKPSQVTFIDWIGYTWKCHFDVNNDAPISCTFSGEWRNLCNARNLLEGSTVKFGVTQPSNNTTVHVKVSPFIGVRTTLIAPTTNGGHKAFYQTQQFYML